jgi:hypothetical protein
LEKVARKDELEKAARDIVDKELATINLNESYKFCTIRAEAIKAAIKMGEWADTHPHEFYKTYVKFLGANPTMHHCFKRIKTLEDMLEVAEGTLEKFDRNIAERHEATDTLIKIHVMRKEIL